MSEAKSKQAELPKTTTKELFEQPCHRPPPQHPDPEVLRELAARGEAPTQYLLDWHARYMCYMCQTSKEEALSS
jgi:hypothetical protein